MKPFILFAVTCMSILAIVFFTNRQRLGPSDVVAASDDPGSDHPRELGLVHWKRGYDRALVEAGKGDKPVLILFQEVPGCATCVGYGQQVLSNPLIVDAIESSFIPLAVYNNIGGDDRRTLEKFHEPSWNNPVVRIISADEQSLAPRVDGDYTEYGLVKAMTTALKKSGKAVPAYLALLETELDMLYRGTEKATFAMSCFWTGEAELGSLEGVASTRPGFLNGHEVVEVEYDPSVISYASLVQRASEQKCAARVYTRSRKQQTEAARIVGTDAQPESSAIRPDNEPKYYLSRNLLRFVPMTPLQQVRVNSALGRDLDPLQYLSPRQIRLYETVRLQPGAGWKSIVGSEKLAEDWQRASSLAARL